MWGGAKNPLFAIKVGVGGGGEDATAVRVVRDGDGTWPVLLLDVDGLPLVYVERDGERLSVVDDAKGVFKEGFYVYLRSWHGQSQRSGENLVDTLNGQHAQLFFPVEGVEVVIALIHKKNYGVDGEGIVLFRPNTVVVKRYPLLGGDGL